MPGEPGAAQRLLSRLTGPVALSTSQAYAQSLDPVVGLGSLLTGRYPSAIPLCGSAGSVAASAGLEVWCHYLPPERETVPGVLAHYGYRTALFHQLLGEAGLASSFQVAVDLGSGSDVGATPWESLRSDLTAWWLAEPASPRMAVLVLPDIDLVRRPDLLPVAPDEESPRAPGAASVFEASRAVAVQRSSRRRDACASIQKGRLTLARREGARREAPTHFTTLERQEALARYRDEADHLGGRLQGLLDLLPPPAGRARVVVVAGLHGLSIGEYEGTSVDESRLLWSNFVVDRTIRVPLVWLDDVGGAAVAPDHPVELVDIAPTIFARAGVVPPHGLPGVDLLDSVGSPDLEAEVAYCEYGDMLALRRGDHLLTLRAMVHNMSSLDPFLGEILACPGLREGFWLHDVRADPYQELDLVDALPELAASLEQAMIERRTGPGALPPESLQDDQLLQLRLAGAEGYW